VPVGDTLNALIRDEQQGVEALCSVPREPTNQPQLMRWSSANMNLCLPVSAFILKVMYEYGN